MAEEGPQRCVLCNAQLRPDDDVCPNCGTDTSLFDLDTDLEDLGSLKDTRSLDELLASVLNDPASPSPSSPTAAQAETTGTEGLEDLDLDLDLPDEPVARPRLDLDILEEPTAKPQPVDEPAAGAEETARPPAKDDALTYQCPECGASVDSEAVMCYSCGALFASEGSFACPECQTAVPVDAPSCPSCGVYFVEDDAPSEAPASGSLRPTPPPQMQPRTSLASAEMAPSGELVRRIMAKYRRREQEQRGALEGVTDLQTALHSNVSDLRTLVALARSLRVPTESVQRKVAEATKRARSKDLAGAVRLAHGARLAMEQSVAIQLAKRLEMVEADLRDQRTRGNAYPVAEELIQEAVSHLESGQVELASEKLARAKEDLSSSMGGQTDARYALQSAQEIVQDMAPLGFQTTGLQDDIVRGQQALRQGNYEMAVQIAGTVQQRATESLQAGLAGEMKRAKEVVMNLKMQGRDVARPIALLKQASASIKERNYEEAMQYLRALRQEVGG